MTHCRDFLKSVIAAGIAVALPIPLAEATDQQIESAWQELLGQMLGQKRKSRRWGLRLPIQVIDLIGRGDRIRTCDPLHPMQVRYQAALHPE